VLSDAELYQRGIDTVLASSKAYTSGAAVRRLPGLAAAVVPHDPERGVDNNAILEHGLASGARVSGRRRAGVGVLCWDRALGRLGARTP
jgi:hypothetical protein